jgi:hypothetical protein
MLKGFFHVPSGKRTSKRLCTKLEKQPFKQLTLKCGILKSTCHYISGEKLELEYKTMSAPHDQHRRNPPCEKLHVEKLFQMH